MARVSLAQAEAAAAGLIWAIFERDGGFTDAPSFSGPVFVGSGEAGGWASFVAFDAVGRRVQVQPWLGQQVSSEFYSPDQVFLDLRVPTVAFHVAGLLQRKGCLLAADFARGWVDHRFGAENGVDPILHAATLGRLLLTEHVAALIVLNARYKGNTNASQKKSS